MTKEEMQELLEQITDSAFSYEFKEWKKKGNCFVLYYHEEELGELYIVDEGSIHTYGKYLSDAEKNVIDTVNTAKYVSGPHGEDIDWCHHVTQTQTNNQKEPRNWHKKFTTRNHILPTIKNLIHVANDEEIEHLYLSTEYKLGKFYSWEILSKDVAIKNCDATFLDMGESGIPQEIYWFFCSENLAFGESKTVSLIYQDMTYMAKIRRKNDKVGRITISWRGELHNLLKSQYKNMESDIQMCFRKNTNDSYSIEFVNTNIIENDDNSPNYSEIETQTAVEGKKILVFTQKYERDPKLRKQAIMIHGTKCEVCGFDFLAFYGEIGRDFIEVHHIKPLSEANGQIKVDPSKDLVCLCSNCHRMIHRNRNHILSINELRSMLKHE